MPFTRETGRQPGVQIRGLQGKPQHPVDPVADESMVPSGKVFVEQDQSNHAVTSGPGSGLYVPLTEAQIEAIKAEYIPRSHDHSQKAIAQRYSDAGFTMSASTVGRIVRDEKGVRGRNNRVLNNGHDIRERLLQSAMMRQDLSGLDGFRERQRRINSVIVGFAKIGEGDWVLDVCTGAEGCGSQVLAANAHFIGLDVAKTSLEKHPQRGNLTLGDAILLPYADNTFTHVFAVMGLHNVMGTSRSVKEIYRTLKPGGKMVIADNGPSMWGNDLIIYGLETREVIDPNKSLFHPHNRQNAQIFTQKHGLDPYEYAKLMLRELYGMTVNDFTKVLESVRTQKEEEYKRLGKTSQPKLTQSIRWLLGNTMRGQFLNYTEKLISATGFSPSRKGITLASRGGKERWYVHVIHEADSSQSLASVYEGAMHGEIHNIPGVEGLRREEYFYLPIGIYQK